MAAAKKIARYIYRNVKSVSIISWILPPKRFIDAVRRLYQNLINFPFLFYILHCSIFYRGILAGVFIGTYMSPKTSWCWAPYFFLGTYEKELQFIWEDLVKRKIILKEILIIGAAEGYYVCGLGRNYRNSRITAFEISEQSRKILQINIDSNHLSDRVKILSACTHLTLYLQLQDNPPDFLLCDIEGYENSLFTEEILSMLVNTILLIEIHPAYELLMKLPYLEKTHTVIQINPEIRTLKDYTLTDFAPASKRLEWMNEKRPFFTPWILAFPKSLENMSQVITNNVVGL